MILKPLLMPGWRSEMQIRHGLLYFLTHAITASAAFITLAYYTRWISVEDYGVYSTLLVLANSANTILFNWMYVGIMRYWNDASISSQALQGVILIALLAITGSVILVSLLYALMSGAFVLAGSFALLLSSGALFMAYQRINSIRLDVSRYLYVELLRVVVATAGGMTLVWMGYSWQGVIIATSLGFLLVPLFSAHFWRSFWHYPFQLERKVFKALLQYGLPLSITFMLLEVIHASDRVLLSTLLGFDAAGQYAVAFGLPFQILIMLASAVNMAAYPVIMKTLEQSGEAAVRAHLEQYVLILLGVIIPAWLGMVAVAEDFLPFLIGEAFLAEAISLLPAAGLAVSLNCVYVFHTSLAFQLGKKTGKTIQVVGLAALLNIILNVWLIPRYGLTGALYASILAYLLCVVYGHWLGSRCFRLPVPGLEILKILSAAVVMLIMLRSLPIGHGLIEGGVRILLGAGLYATLLILANAGGIRKHVDKLCRPFQTNT